MSSRKESSAVINPVEMKGMGWLITGGRETVVDDNIEMAITAVAPLRESMWANSNLGYDWIPFYLLTSHRPILRPRFRTMRRRPPPLPARVRESVFWLSVARNAVQWSPDVTSLTFTDTKGFCHSPPPWISYNFLLKSPADRNNGRASWRTTGWASSVLNWNRLWSSFEPPSNLFRVIERRGKKRKLRIDDS